MWGKGERENETVAGEKDGEVRRAKERLCRRK